MWVLKLAILQHSLLSVDYHDALLRMMRGPDDVDAKANPQRCFGGGAASPEIFRQEHHESVRMFCDIAGHVVVDLDDCSVAHCSSFSA
jgi:hypothetical protein